MDIDKLSKEERENLLAVLMGESGCALTEEEEKQLMSVVDSPESTKFLEELRKRSKNTKQSSD